MEQKNQLSVPMLIHNQFIRQYDEFFIAFQNEVLPDAHILYRILYLYMTLFQNVVEDFFKSGTLKCKEI